MYRHQTKKAYNSFHTKKFIILFRTHTSKQNISRKTYKIIFVLNFSLAKTKKNNFNNIDLK